MNRLFIVLLLALSIPVQADDTVLTKPGLKILALGNSYTDNYFSLLKEFTAKSGSDVNDMCLYRISRSYASFKAWIDMYEDKDKYDYYFNKILGGLNASVSPATGKAGDGTVLRNVLTKEQWDLILIQAYSREATDYDAWVSNGYLDQLIDLLKEEQPNAKIGFVMAHSYWDDYAMNYQHSSYDRWELIAEAAKNLTENYDIEMVVPCGTAIENLRASSLNNEYDLTLDGTHLGYGLARYTAAACCYEALIAPRSGISAYGNSMRVTTPETTTSQYPCYDVTDDNAPIAQRAALEAVSAPFTCTNPEEETITITDQGNGRGITTYSSLYDLDFSEVAGEHFKVFIANGYDPNTSTVKGVSIKKASAGMGIFIKADAGIYKIARRPVNDDYVNMLVGVPEVIWVTQTDGPYTNFGLGRRNGKIGFYPFSKDGNFGPNKAYLQLPTSLVSGANTNTIGFTFDDEGTTDSISDIEQEKTDSGIYTLSGMKMTGLQTPEGIYITGGKKIVIK